MVSSLDNNRCEGFFAKIQEKKKTKMVCLGNKDDINDN